MTKPPLTLYLAAPRGFCAGVDRAIKIVEMALAKWGAPAGPYLVIPLFGPRTVRSGIGNLADIQVNKTIVGGQTVFER